MEKYSSSQHPRLFAKSVFFQEIDGAFSPHKVLERIAETTKLKRQYLENLRALIDEREKKNKFQPSGTCRRMVQPYAFQQDLNSRQWIANLCHGIEDSDTEQSDDEITDQMYREMLRNHKRKRRCSEVFSSDSYFSKYMHMSADYINRKDEWPSHKKAFKRVTKPVLKLPKSDRALSGTEIPSNASQDSTSHNLSVAEYEVNSNSSLSLVSSQMKKKKSVNMDLIRRKHWKLIAKKEIPKAFRNRLQNRASQLVLLRKVSRDIMKRQRANASASLKLSKEKSGRARRITREMQLFWKKYNKVEKVHRKKAERHALEQIRLDEELREAKRQQRKLNFLISQTELFAHFMSKKLSKEQDADHDTHTKEIMKSIEKDWEESHDNAIDDIVDASFYSRQAIENVNKAMEHQRSQTAAFNTETSTSSWDKKSEAQQPSLFKGALKSYQLKGMNWLINLYEQGINGILADEMGLGKTVQTIAFFGHLAQRLNIWGPFLVVAPASTLNNWHQEFTKFFPDFTVLPYWGNPADRKVLRKFWNQKASYHSDRNSAPFHILITSYQLVISDVRYFQRIKWQYMVLDEAQALKSTASVRWKILLEFNCRNRLLLTGTPIQNTMAELWALLHFIMPSLFDSHDEFNEWFSKDIENHIENKSYIDETHLSRLHMILKPFMLRRIKRDVENELSEKIEIRVHCGLSPRQKSLYNALKQNIRLEDLVKSTGSTSTSTGSGHTLMNLVMQFRKVCNHPDLFEKREAISPFACVTPLVFRLPKLLYRDGILGKISHCKRKLLYCDLNIHHPSNITFENSTEFNFLRLLQIGVGEYSKVYCKGLPYLLFAMKLIMLEKSKLYYHNTFHDSSDHARLQPIFKSMLLTQIDTFKAFNECSPFKDLLFTSAIRSGNNFSAISVHTNYELDSVSLPKVVSSIFLPAVITTPQKTECSDRSFCNEMQRYSAMTVPYRLAHCSYCVTHGTMKQTLSEPITYHSFGLGLSHIHIPSKEYLITDSGKLYALEILLLKLKAEGHRVLIYSQMTRMIDILEEYMLYRGYTYIRLDGSSRISERRDMVADFQTRADIFAFLLSTRAGGLGINLTAADTVIFYDSDWNPTVDQQAMDRAHRLGQTKQVTVYRLVCEGTVDERILQRAEEKNAIQRMVIAGGSFKPDLLKTKEVVSLLLDDDQLIQRLKIRREENRGEVLTYKGKKRGRKSNAEREAKRLQQLQDQGITGTISGAMSGNITISHSESNSPTTPDLFEAKFLSSSNLLSTSSESATFLDSAPISPASDVGISNESKIKDNETIVVDDISSMPVPHVSNVKALLSRTRGRGRPRIRPLQDTGIQRQYRKHLPIQNTGTPVRRRASRVRRIFSGRAAAMAGKL